MYVERVSTIAALTTDYTFSTSPTYPFHLFKKVPISFNSGEGILFILLYFEFMLEFLSWNHSDTVY